MRSAAAAPTLISISSARLPPETAPIFAVPDCELPMNLTVALPPDVCASRCSMVPNDAVKVTMVPLWTGVPPDSMTDAMISAVPLMGTTVVLTLRMMVDSVGAVRGTLSQPTSTPQATTASTTDDQARDSTGIEKDNRLMILEGQGNCATPTLERQRGYAMAALLVGLSVMAVLMGMMLPVWTHMAQREKEEELIFRGQQYARAIGIFQRKFANTAPPTIDLLVEQRFLRKKYKDPITNDDFQPIYANQAPQTVGTPAGSSRPGEAATTNRAVEQPQAVQSRTGPGAPGGIIGVTSKSKESSIKIYNGRSKYNEWAFVYVQTAQRPDGSGTQAPGQPGTNQPGAGPQGPGRGPSPFGNPGGTQGGFGSPAGSGGSGRPPVPFPSSGSAPGMQPPGPPPPVGVRRPGQ